MKLRRNRRLAGMSGDIMGHLTRDEELRKNMLQQQNAVMSPDEDLPQILKDQIARDLKDPKMQEEFRSGPEGKQRIIEHFRNMGSQIDRLKSLKDLEKRVLEREKRIARGEEVEFDAEEDGDGDFNFDPTVALRDQSIDPSSTSPADLVEREYRRFVQQRDGFQHYETQTQTSLEEHVAALKELPTKFKVKNEELAALDATMQRDGVQVPSEEYKTTLVENYRAPTPKDHQISEPTPTSSSRSAFKDGDALMEDSEVAELGWPSEQEVAESDAEFASLDQPDIREDVSPFSHFLRAERLRREQEQEDYIEVATAQSTVPPLPLIYREYIKTQLQLKLPIHERFYAPFLPAGMTKEEFFMHEGIIADKSEDMSISTEEAMQSEPIDTDAPQKVPGSCCSTLRDATEKRHLNCLSALCDPANGVIATGETPLHIAAILDNVKCAKELIDKKVCKINTLSTGRSSALHLACMRANMDMVKYLVQQGSHMNQPDDDGLTPLHLAVASDATTSLVAYLLDHGANLHSTDNQGANVLHIAADSGNVPMIRLLLGKGASINELTGDHESATFLATEQGHLEALEMLLANGGNANEPNANGFHAVHAAVKRGSYDILEALLDSKVPANSAKGSTGAARAYVKDAGDNTPLHICALVSKGEVPEDTALRMAKKLIASGCPVSEINSEGWNALHIAAQVGSSALVRLFVETGCSIHARNDEGGNALHIALSAEKFDIIPLLLELGADLNVGDANNVTPLLLAIQAGRGDLAQTFIDKGARTNTLTSDNISPLHMALEEGLMGIADVILSKGALATQETQDGYQAIHIVAARGDLDWVQKLLDHGADANALTQAGLTPLRLAQENGHREVVALLEKAGAREMDIFAWMEIQEAKKAKEASSN